MGETEEYSKWERLAETLTRILTPVLSLTKPKVKAIFFCATRDGGFF